MAYAARFSGKTLSASILEVLTVLHLKRDVIHMAAITDQSKKAQEYVKKYFNKPIIREFVQSNNAKEIHAVWYNGPSGILTESEFKVLDSLEREKYLRNENYVRIIACTMQATNGQHTNGLFVNDELDVIQPENIKAYHQAAAIPSSSGGIDPVTLLTSTRKSRIGLVQAEIDEAHKSGLQLRHWNIIDVTEPCLPDRHKPELPKATYYICDADVDHITEEDYKLLGNVQQAKYYPVEGFAGCKTCRLFAACKGRLATHQKGDPKKIIAMSSIRDIAAKMKKSKPEFITTEFLCRKPDTSGLVYPRLSRDRHMVTASQMAHIMEDEAVASVKDKATLIAYMKSKGTSFYAGMDFGFTHDFSLVTFGLYGANVFVLDCFAQAGLELDDQIASSEYVKELFDNPPIYADTAYPGPIKTFRRKGFKMRDWDKNAGSKLAGIEIVRTLLWSGKGLVRLYFLAGDPGVEHLFGELEKYRLKMDAAGRFTEDPVDEENDSADACRYGLMNVLGSKGALKEGGSIVRLNPNEVTKTLQEIKAGQQQEWMTKAIRDAVGGEPESTSSQPVNRVVKKGRFVWDG
jgi:hypothetical protein